MNDHLDLDALADVLAGGDDTHLSGCASCQARLAELRTAIAAVSGDLTHLPLPTEPADLAARLAAALADARPRSADVLPLTAKRSSFPWLPAAAAVAAAAALVTGGVLYTQRDSGREHTATQAEAHLVTSSTGSDYTKTSLAPALRSILAGTGQTQDMITRTSPTPEAVQAPKATTLSGHSPAFATGPDPLAVLRTTAGLAACLTSLTDPGDTTLPLALDYAAFEDKPALVVVYPVPGNDTKVNVFVVGATCRQADADLLFFTRLPKP